MGIVIVLNRWACCENAGKILSSITRKHSVLADVMRPMLQADNLFKMECPSLKPAPPSLSVWSLNEAIGTKQRFLGTKQ